MKKLVKNKFFILAICVIVICVVYFFLQKAIDNYVFNSDEEIFIDEGLLNNEEVTEESAKDVSNGEFSGDLQQISEEEVDVEVEEVEENVTVSTVDSEVSKKIHVYITGEVNNPGVVILDEGCRIVDAINAAGGTTVKANITKVNLVYVLNDGMKVNIPNSNDLKNNPNFEYITMNSGDGGNDDYLNSTEKGDGGGSYSNINSSNSGSASSGDANLGTGSYVKYGVVNINTATQTELESLPGIGPSLALKIINYRKENGKFSCIEDIKNVSGIGESKFEGLKRFITV